MHTRPQVRNKADKLSSFKYDYNNLINVLVGPKETAFAVYKDSICMSSKFFAAACSPGRWREGREKLVHLPESPPQAFQAYVHWVYTGEISPMVYFGEQVISEAMEAKAHIEAYIIGEFLDDAKLRTKALDNLITKIVTWRTMIPSSLIGRAYETTPVGSPLRRLLVEEWINYSKVGRFTRKMAELPEDSIADVVESLTLKRKKQTASEMLKTFRAVCDSGEGN